MCTASMFCDLCAAFRLACVSNTALLYHIFVIHVLTKELSLLFWHICIYIEVSNNHIHPLISKHKLTGSKNVLLSFTISYTTLHFKLYTFGRYKTCLMTDTVLSGIEATLLWIKLSTPKMELNVNYHKKKTHFWI